MKDHETMKREMDLVVKFVQLQLEQTSSARHYRKDLFE